MLNLPLALIGGVAGVYLSGGVLNVATIIGFITLFGIATRNGIMLVSHTLHLLEQEGVTEFREAVERGAQERLIPILMTAMTPCQSVVIRWPIRRPAPSALPVNDRPALGPHDCPCGLRPASIISPRRRSRW